jgi:hypothetical protein
MIADFLAVVMKKGSWKYQPLGKERKSGAPGAIRTPGPQIRSLVLYPAELRVHWSAAIRVGLGAAQGVFLERALDLERPAEQCLQNSGYFKLQRKRIADP